MVWNDGAAEAVVVDAGWDAEIILEALRSRGLAVTAQVLTHCHGDHIGAVGAVKEAFPTAPIYVPEAEQDWLSRPTLNLSYFYGFSIVAPPGDVLVNEGNVFELAGLQLKAIHVPGHSPGGTAYLISPAGSRPHLYCGDILFRNGIGRTDLPGGAGEAVLVEGIREKIFRAARRHDCLPRPRRRNDNWLREEKQSVLRGLTCSKIPFAFSGAFALKKQARINSYALRFSEELGK